MGLAALATVMVGAACAGRPPVAEPPTAEFLVAAGDSTYWIRSGPEGVRVRRAPILLTRVEDRFYEIFIADDVVDYDDAAFARARLYARDVTQADSVLLFADSTVEIEAARWRRAHPTAEPLDAEDDAPSANPSTSVSDDLEILEVHGPYISLTHVLDVDVPDSTRHRHAGRRMVIDVRTGTRPPLSALVGDAEAARVVTDARERFRLLMDSIRTTADQRATTARATLSSFHFDSTGFGLTDLRRAPAVAFMIPGTALDGGALALNLPPIGVATPTWWTSVQGTLPEWAADSTQCLWRATGYTLTARPDSSGETLALSLRAAESTPGARRATGAASVPNRTASAAWPVVTVPAPAYQWVPLDMPPLPAALRTALARAFDAASAHGGTVQTVKGAGRPHRPRRSGA